MSQPTRARGKKLLWCVEDRNLSWKLHLHFVFMVLSTGSHDPGELGIPGLYAAHHKARGLVDSSLACVWSNPSPYLISCSVSSAVSRNMPVTVGTGNNLFLVWCLMVAAGTHRMVMDGTQNVVTPWLLLLRFLCAHDSSVCCINLNKSPNIMPGPLPLQIPAAWSQSRWGRM